MDMRRDGFEPALIVETSPGNFKSGLITGPRSVSYAGSFFEPSTSRRLDAPCGEKAELSHLGV